MPEVGVSLNFVENSKNILVNGLGTTAININYSADIDFTPLVEVLLDNVANENTFRLQLPSTEGKDEKEKLVISTISEIIAKYNEIVATTPEGEDEAEG